jgi:hypothetical protein
MVMRTPILIGSVCLAALAGCGLEGVLANAGRGARDRPASALGGTASWSGASGSQISAIDGDGNAVEAFASRVDAGVYELKLPSSRYAMLRAQGRAGNFVLRTLVPSLGEETSLGGVDLDARGTTETLIVEARLSADGKKLQQLTPDAYVGDGDTTGTRTLIRQAFEVPGPTQDLLRMVERLIQGRANPSAGSPEPSFFRPPVLTPAFVVTESPLDASFLAQAPFDYDGDGAAESTSADFDARLAEVAQLYDPSGCPATDRIRLVFSVDFNEGALNGNCGTINRFKWAKDAPGKSMFFVGWVYTSDPPGASEVRDPAINRLLGAGVPNQIPMYDDGTNGDEVAGDNVWAVFFDVPFDPSRALRVGYKYTWGSRGAPWTGSEEWPGNSRMIEVVDVNGDGFVHRRDVFGDEATNKDKYNLNLTGAGNIGWTTVLLGAPAGCVDLGGVPIPEAREQPATAGSACSCTGWLTPRSIGPLRVACGP